VPSTNALEASRELETKTGAMGTKKLFVSNLRKSVDANDLTELFDHYGLVRHADVWGNEYKQSSKTFGVVEMANERDAKRAVRALDGQLWHGRKLKVSESRSIFGRRDE
jgi:cold-inducible RNA-binding protein